MSVPPSEEFASHVLKPISCFILSYRIFVFLFQRRMAISLVFDGHVRNVDNLGLNVFVTFTIAAATELPADTFLTLVLDRWGRRWLACGSLVVSGIFSIWASAVSNRLYISFFLLHHRHSYITLFILQIRIRRQSLE